MKNKITKKHFKSITIIIGVIVIPLLYSYFYLGAFWDPYSRLQSLPVAVVNNDMGAEINGTMRNIGNEMCEKLKEDGTLKFVFTDAVDAKAGTKGSKYYAMIVLPSDLSKDIASASTTNKQTASIIYSANEKRNYLASQILGKAVLQIEVAMRESVNKEIVLALTNKLNSVPEQMSELQNGVNQLFDGSTQISNGASALSDGADALDSGIKQLLLGVNKISESTSNIEELSLGAAKLAKAASTFNESLAKYTEGVDTLITSIDKTTNFLSYYIANVNPDIMKDPIFANFIAELSNANNKQNLIMIKNANTQLKVASQNITSGVETLASKTTDLPQLKEALMLLSNGISSAKTGSSALTTGAASLEKGTFGLNSGIEKVKVGIDSSISESNKELGSIEGLADFAKAPVNVSQENINSVPNYGTAFAPYFMSLSLWVGGLMIFIGIYYDPDNKFKILSRDCENKVKRSFVYLLIGFIQAIVLGIVLKLGLGLQVDNMALYFVSCCLVSMVFIAIIQFLMVFLKDLGKFLCMLLLILQLTSCGGTFPMETVPNIFNILYSFMPMTYSVGLFKQAISGVEINGVFFNMGILMIMLVIFMALTIIFSKFKNEKQIEL